MYTIKLSNGNTIDNLTVNGNNFVSQTEILDSVFENGLDDVEVTNTETGEVYHMTNGFLIQSKKYGNEWWFIIGEKSQDTKQNEIDIDLSGKIDYLAMMLDIEFMGV